ncbi:ketopantoate reductase [Comamonas sp. BIGb0124]|uniref:ketopantoate reductase family protein n=1 Tax=Comamonas sp. BIGb0124 TaxID=2485130 RepID=UPI000F4A3E4B|nr:2-dehydropantoate 2-reductase [Comamonas sp. BIGb0124]ROR18411.1 ketopantoate reductase [Comamonas sp. BIGb0124]
MSSNRQARICIYGAGAIGGHVGARLAHAGQVQLSVVARGAHLQAIRQHGLHLTSGADQWQGAVAQATDDPSTLEEQDFVLVGLKAHSLPAHAAAIRRLLGRTGVAVFMTNGIPWWWNHGLSGEQAYLPLLDPDGTLWHEITPQRAIGCVIYSPNAIEAPGRIRHAPGRNLFVFGEPAGGGSERLSRLLDLLATSGLPVASTDDIRQEIWLKLLINASGNTLSALTRLGNAARAASPELESLGAALVHEVARIAAAAGWPLPDERVVAASTTLSGGVNQYPSMLQDVFAGRVIEVEPILGQPQAFARHLNIPTPAIDVVVALLRGLNRHLEIGQTA